MAKNRTIILNKEDVNNPLHPNLWDSFLETLGVDKDATEVCLKISHLDHNKIKGCECRECQGPGRIT